MPRQKTGRPVGRPSLYSDDERPVTVSLRIPHDLAEQTKRYASLRRQSVTELLLDGLRWRIGEGDPRGLGTVLPQQSPSGEQYYGNTETSHGGLTDTAGTAVLEEIRTTLACQATQLRELAQAIMQHSSVPAHNQYLSNTIIEDEQTENSTALEVLPVRDREEDNRQTATVPPEVPTYDPARYQLGALCKRGHAWGDTGQSLREIRQGKMTDCAECHRERARAANARRLVTSGATQ